MARPSYKCPHCHKPMKNPQGLAAHLNWHKRQQDSSPSVTANAAANSVGTATSAPTDAKISNAAQLRQDVNAVSSDLQELLHEARHGLGSRHATMLALEFLRLRLDGAISKSFATEVAELHNGKAA